MKAISIFTCYFLCSIICSSQQLDSWFTIKAFLPQWDHAAVTIEKENVHLGSGYVINDIFSFNGSGSRAVPATMHLNKNGRNLVLSFFIEPGTIRIRARSEFDVYVTGTPLNDAYAKFCAGADSAALLKTGAEEAVKRDMATAFIKQNPSSLISLCLLNDFFYMNKNADDSIYLLLYNNLTDTLKQTYAGRKIGEEAAERYMTRSGSIAPISELYNNVNILSPLYAKGDITVIHFWATWCLPCREEMVLLKNIYSRNKYIKVVTVSLDRDNNQWKRSLNSFSPEWLNLIDPSGWEGKAAKTYGVKTIPANFLIDKNGMIMGSHLSMEQLEIKLKELK
jgi:thiol-disulfide isomerase/thioredoxin